MNHVNLLWQHDNGITSNPCWWLGEAGGEGGESGSEALPQILVSERGRCHSKESM